MSRRRRRLDSEYTDKAKTLDEQSQLEIDRNGEPTVVSLKPKKHKPSRRGRRGRGLNKPPKEEKELTIKKSSPNKTTEVTKVTSSKSVNEERQNNNDAAVHFADRIEFVVAAKCIINNNGHEFVDVIGKPTTIFRNAVKNCPSKYSVYNTEGIKVYPMPPQRLGTDKYTIRRLDNHEMEAMKYSELSEAIKHCRDGCGVFNPQNERVY